MVKGIGVSELTEELELVNGERNWSCSDWSEELRSYGLD